MCASFEEKHELNFITFLRRGTEFHGKTKVNTILRLDIHIRWFESG
jgi:hypothetical protein